MARSAADVREWPGVPTAKPHGTPVEWEHPNDDPFRYCESCGGQHHPNNKSCNGLRDHELYQCRSVLGEMRCHRPLGHLGECIADSAVFRVEWRIKNNAVVGTPHRQDRSVDKET